MQPSTPLEQPPAALTVDTGRRTLSRQHALALLFFTLLFLVFFSPAILSGRFLAPGDGTLYYLPHYEMPSRLWNPYSMTGFPEFGDPQLMKWYFPKLLLSWIPGSWNFFVISAYVLASWFTYRYTRALRVPGFGALLAGTSFGLCGFMIGHLGHTSIIHAAAWIPGLLWAMEELAGTLRVRWVMVGAVTLSQSILAGHPQIALYGLALTSAYLIFRLMVVPRRIALFAMSTSVLLLAFLLSAVQTLSTAATASTTTRAHLSFAQFSEYSLSIYELALLVFPCLFGGAGAEALDGIPFFGAWNITEVAGYVGMTIAALAMIAILSRFRQRVVVFWTAAALISLSVALGNATPICRLIYLLPGFGQFRAPARFIYIGCFAMSVLASQGIAAIAEHPRKRRDIALISGIFLAVFAAALLIDPLFGAQIREAAATHNVHNLPLSVFGNRWLKIPVGSALLLTALLVAFIQRPASYGVRALLLAGVIFELGTFGWYAEWRYGSPTTAMMQPPAYEKEYEQRLREAGGRWLAVRGSIGGLSDAPPDLNALWGLASIGKYGPLMPSRFRELAGIESNGVVFGDWWDAADRALDILGARLVAFTFPPPSPPAEDFKGVGFPAEDINLVAGRGCGATSADGSIEFAKSKRATTVGIVSLTGCSPGFPQGTPILELHFHGEAGRSSTSVLRAGIDTAEWAAACADVIPTMKHRAAEVYSRFTVPRDAGTCQAQRYGAFAELSGGPLQVQSMDFHWLPQREGSIRVVKLVFIDNATKKTDPVRVSDEWVSDRTRWRRFGQNGMVHVYENLRSMPRAWLVPETISLPADAIVRTIKTSRLPDGRTYEPGEMALIEQSLGFRAKTDADGHAWVTEDRDTIVQVQTIDRQPSFLVLGDLYFPGWIAELNGRQVPILPTNYVQRGVLLPPGQNFVRLEFRPTSLYLGIGITTAGLLIACAIVLLAKRRGVL